MHVKILKVLFFLTNSLTTPYTQLLFLKLGIKNEQSKYVLQDTSIF